MFSIHHYTVHAFSLCSPVLFLVFLKLFPCTIRGPPPKKLEQFSTGQSAVANSVVSKQSNTNQKTACYIKAETVTRPQLINTQHAVTIM